MQVPDLKGLLGSARPVIVPDGLPAAPEIFGPLCETAGLGLEISSKIVPDRVEHLAARNPALLIVPTSFKISGQILDIARNRIGAFGSVSTGTDHVDLRAFAVGGLRFFHAPGANSLSVAEYVASAIVDHVGVGALGFGHEVTLGIVGYGRIGSLVGRFGSQLGCDICYYDPFVDADPDRKRTNIADVLSCDVVSLHVPLTHEGGHPTKEMIDSTLVDLVRPEAFFINTCRGGVLTTEAFRALAKRGPSLMDVFPREPPESWMVELPHRVTPHIAGYSYEARAGGTRAVAVEFAKALGLGEGVVPAVPLVSFDHYVSSFLEGESARLKADPASFHERRSRYPNRGSLQDAAARGARTDSEAFLFERILG